MYVVLKEKFNYIFAYNDIRCSANLSMYSSFNMSQIHRNFNQFFLFKNGNIWFYIIAYIYFQVDKYCAFLQRSKYGNLAI